ncbi:hypothetical protein ANN_01825 [Periplaneta americana]|uniref:Uncharacterized protein n=1 Tax=Periplaneta americana TaxID=6978 RepID=A0ABQ8TUL4_PERAM|nr:hypothetical protein ANN_01825 [Periplaneta americana]
MVGLCEDGNEPPGSLKVIKNPFSSSLDTLSTELFQSSPVNTVPYKSHNQLERLENIGRADVIAISGRLKRALVLDPTIRFERNLNQATEVDTEKKSIYEPCLPYLSQKYNVPLKQWSVIGLLFGSRGSNTKFTWNYLKELHIPFDYVISSQLTPPRILDMHNCVTVARADVLAAVNHALGVSQIGTPEVEMGGHVLRMDHRRWTHRLTLWDPRIGRRRVGRQTTRWADFFKKKAGPHWTSSTRDRQLWRNVEATILIFKSTSESSSEQGSQPSRASGRSEFDVQWNRIWKTWVRRAVNLSESVTVAVSGECDVVRKTWVRWAVKLNSELEELAKANEL